MALVALFQNIKKTLKQPRMIEGIEGELAIIEPVRLSQIIFHSE